MRCRLGDSRLRTGQIHILIQLYSVRRQIEADYFGTLRQLRQAGARNAELYWFDVQPPAADMKNIFSDAGIRPLAMHVSLPTLTHAMAEVIDTCHEMSVPDVVMPWLVPELRQDRDCWRQLGLKLSEFGQTLRHDGIELGYHNHDFEFAADNGELPMQTLLDTTHAARVFWEMDAYWVKCAG